MHVSFVTPAWGRFAVTRLALAQRRQLVADLALRGITADCVVIADDENLEIARSFGFDTIEMGNEHLGAKVNAGFAWAGERGSDYITFIGSDDWMHIDLFEPLVKGLGDTFEGVRGQIVAGHEITVVDLLGRRMRHLGWRAHHGVPPWFIPRAELVFCGFEPCRPHATRGMEWEISWSLRTAGRPWLFHDPHPLSRVDFKSDTGMTEYETISRSIGRGDEISPPWADLEVSYGAELAEMAVETSGLYAEVIAA